MWRQKRLSVEQGLDVPVVLDSLLQRFDPLGVFALEFSSGQVFITLNVRRHEFRQPDRVQQALATRDAKFVPLSVSTGSPPQSCSEVVVWPLYGHVSSEIGRLLAIDVCLGSRRAGRR